MIYFKSMGTIFVYLPCCVYHNDAIIKYLFQKDYIYTNMKPPNYQCSILICNNKNEKSKKRGVFVGPLLIGNTYLQWIVRTSWGYSFILTTTNQSPAVVLAQPGFFDTSLVSQLPTRLRRNF